ncbi:hypothetical protein ACS0TY_030307 [Phlomoides rotata]
MATSRSSSVAARLSRLAAASLRASGVGQSTRSHLVAPHRALIAANENKISIPNSLSASFLNHRIASNSALTRPYSTAAATVQIPGVKVENSSNWLSLVANIPNRTLWHMYEGMEEILADYIHQETTRTWMLVCFRLYLIITFKDAFLALAGL